MVIMIIVFNKKRICKTGAQVGFAVNKSFVLLGRPESHKESANDYIYFTQLQKKIGRGSQSVGVSKYE